MGVKEKDLPTSVGISSSSYIRTLNGSGESEKTSFTTVKDAVTPSNATTSSDGLMSSGDKSKLNGIESQANRTIVDSALSDSSINPVQNKVVTGAVNDLKSAITSGIVYGPESVISGNLFPFRTDSIDGKYYYAVDGVLVESTNADFYGFILKVEPDTDYCCTFFRFLVKLESDKHTAIGEPLTSNAFFNSGTAEYVAVSFAKTTYPVETYFICKGYAADTSEYKVYLEWLYSDPNASKVLPSGVQVKEQSPAAGSSLVAIDYSNNVKYNKRIMYAAHFSGSIGNISLYHGAGTYGSILRITPTNIIVITSDVEVYNSPHNLTISDYLYIFIDTDDQNNAMISVMSNGSRTEITVDNWEGWQGQVFANTASALTEHRLTWCCEDTNCDIWVFGDSYLSKTSVERWGYYLKLWGFDNYLAVGYPGAGSANVINTLEQMLKTTQPKYILWMMGMNDPDSSSGINTTWETNANKVLSLCEKYNVTPIFSKIPNANGAGTLYNHSYKNAWIENSGCRYIDVPYAVGADSSGNWYTGLLASDGIHPSWKGAEAIAYQIIADVPELTEIK